jgi:hypothetical protein
MPTIEQYALAILGAIGFGLIIHVWFGSSWQRLALLLVTLWSLQTGPQYIYRWLSGQDVAQEVISVTLLRTTFTVVAVLSLAFLNRFREDRDE